MNKAYSKLHGNSRTTQQLEASHRYARFFPQSYEEVAELVNDTTLSLYQYPLDYEVVSEGNYYQDPDLPEGALMSFYTVVESGHPLNYRVQYEVMTDLYLPEEHEIELEDEAYLVAGMKPLPSLENSRRYNPSGWIHVEDNALGRQVPVRNAHVRIKRLFRIENVRTNEHGYWYSPKRYRGDVIVKVIFEHPYVDIRSTFFETFWSARKKLDQGNKPQGRRYVLRHGTKEWGWATAFNGVMEYYDYCRRFGITTPPLNLKMYVHRKNGDPAFGGSAPMLDKGYKYFNINWDFVRSWLLNKALGGVATVLGALLKETMPDVIINYNQNDTNEADIIETLYHELAHASHYAKVGNGFWSRYISYIINYGSYGDGTRRDAPMVAISEAWGFYTGWFLAQDKYGRNAIVSNAASENYDPLQVGNGTGIATRRTRAGVATGFVGWIPAGIMQDLTDNNADLVRTGFRDNVTGYNTRSLFNALDSDVDSPQDFRDRLLRENSNRDRADVEDLFEAYYFD
ncbi:MAG: hypothetical protein ACLFT3_04655 [Cyclobacteriaceae bacterium]